MEAGRSHQTFQAKNVLIGSVSGSSALLPCGGELKGEMEAKRPTRRLVGMESPRS
jgi:hypothetical protein